MAKGKTGVAKVAVAESADAKEARLWSEVAALKPQKSVYKQTCKNGRSLAEFTKADGVVDTAALDEAVKKAKGL